MSPFEQQVISSQLDEEALSFMGASVEELIQAKAKSRMYVFVENLHENLPVERTLKAEICQAFSIPEEDIFKHTRKREIANARQVYVFLTMTTDVKNKTVIPLEKMIFTKPNPDMEMRDRPNFVARHIGFDHATIYHCCKATTCYYETEKWYRSLIDRLREDIFKGRLELPDVTKAA